ncbi:MAG TPA: acetyltransferase [Acidocella sp.]|uniref:acetyltransferase n=1 Tax=Acidocella sp. TaxID=50710 RepID=UPI002B626F49|nr:acetyltransferase [Acidocella sp.]HVE23089.1 acetyltransferase [Acidocella sp.]
MFLNEARKSRQPDMAAPVTLYGIIGAGGFGRCVLPAARRQLGPQILDGSGALTFVSEAEDSGETKNGTRVIALDTFLNHPGERRFAVAIADSAVRARLVAVCERAGATPFSIIAPSAVTLDSNIIAEGAILCDFTMITCNARIGRHFHANIYSYVEHDCDIGDFVTFAPGVKCNGNVRIHDHAYIGAGAVIRPGKTGKPRIIGEHAVIGMGAVVVHDVPAGATVAGNPARILTPA